MTFMAWCSGFMSGLGLGLVLMQAPLGLVFAGLSLLIILLEREVENNE